MSLRPGQALGVALLLASTARGDGGTVRVSERAGPYRVGAFTSPTPFRAGPVDVSVLVQDAETLAVVPAAAVTVRLWPRGRPGEGVARRATAEAATNKLLRAALFDLPEPGWWDAEVLVDGPGGPAVVRFAAEAGDPLPDWPEFTPWVGWPAVAVTLFALHRVLVRRKTNPPRRHHNGGAGG